MKKLSMLFLGLILMTSWISAGNDPSIESLIVKLEQKVAGNNFTLQIANLQQLATSISLTDSRGVRLHKKQITKANGRLLKYVIKDFEDGKYHLIIEWNNQRSTWILFKKGEQIDFSPESETKAPEA